MLRDLTQDRFNVFFLLTNVAETFSDESVHHSQSCCLLHRQLKIQLNNSQQLLVFEFYVFTFVILNQEQISKN